MRRWERMKEKRKKMRNLMESKMEMKRKGRMTSWMKWTCPVKRKKKVMMKMRKKVMMNKLTLNKAKIHKRK